MADLLTAAAVAVELGISTTAVYRLIHRGTLGRVYIGTRVFIRPDQVEAYRANELYQRRSRAATSQAQSAAKKAVKS